MAGGLRVVEHAQRLAIALVVGVDIAARFLCGDHFTDHFEGRGAELRMVGGLQSEADSLGPFVDIGVRVDGADLGRGRFAFEAEEVVHAAVVDQLVVHRGNAGFEVGDAALRPEALLNFDSANGNCFELGVGRPGDIDDTGVFPCLGRGISQENAAASKLKLRRIAGSPEQLRPGQQRRRQKRGNGGGRIWISLLRLLLRVTRCSRNCRVARVGIPTSN